MGGHLGQSHPRSPMAEACTSPGSLGDVLSVATVTSHLLQWSYLSEVWRSRDSVKILARHVLGDQNRRQSFSKSLNRAMRDCEGHFDGSVVK
jgi:hypothetical protein